MSHTLLWQVPKLFFEHLFLVRNTLSVMLMLLYAVIGDSSVWWVYLDGWTLLVLSENVYNRKLTGSIVVYIPEDPSHDLVVELLLEFIRVRSLGISSLNNNILAGQNWKIIAENMERLLIQMLISGLVKDVVKYVSQKEVIWNEERDNTKYRRPQ